MNNTIKILGLSLVLILLMAAFGVGIAVAQTPMWNPGSVFARMMGGNAGNGTGYSMMGWRGGMMGGYAQNGNNWEWMDAMHQWMVSSGGMHAFVWDAVAGKLGLNRDELYAALNNGKTLAQIAGEKGLDQSELVAALEAAHRDSLAQAVSKGILTQQQADSILAQMAGRYEWMLDNMGNGYAMMGRYGGMMGRYYGQQGSNGQFSTGGCHGYSYNNPANQQPTP